VGSKRALTPSDEDGDEKKGDSEGSAMEEAPTPCSPMELMSKKDKLREKRRKRKERRKAPSDDRWRELDRLQDTLRHSPSSYPTIRPELATLRLI
jgi:hypothetical protein